MRDAARHEPCNATEIARDVADLEAQLISGAGAAVAAVEAVLVRARAGVDDALLGRILCLLSRALIIDGQHEVALRTADEGARAFAKLGAQIAPKYSGLYAETFRAAGSALLKLGRVAEALPKLEEAVRIAQTGIDAPFATDPYATLISAESALLRSLITLGITLFAIREIDTAIGVYYRAMEIADTYPWMYERFLDDVMLARWNLTDALHERANRRRAAGSDELAEQDIAAARGLLDAEAWRIAAAAGDDSLPLSAFGRATYYAALGHHLLITGLPAKALATFEQGLLEIERQNYVDDWGIADAQAGIAQAAMALGSPRDALVHCALAMSALDRHDESNTRATVLLVRATAHRAVGEYAAAFDSLADHHALRTRLEAVAAQQYAGHMTAQLGLERARADAESHRRVAAMLETLGQIGQEITANLDAETVFEIFARHVGALLAATACTIWLLDPGGERLTLAFGIEDERAISAVDVALDDSQSLAARAVRERRELFCVPPPADAPPAKVIDGTRLMQTALFVPLVVGDRVLGVVSIQAENPDAYTEHERLIFRTLSTYAAIALDNAAAYTKLEQTVIALQATQLELATQTAEFERLSMTDPLTGVANRRHLDERAQVEIAALRRKPGQLAVAMFDIDHFKSVNDTYGHAVGDAVLQQIAQVAKQWLRPADLISRIGGEEFALLLPGVGIREAVAIAERIRKSIADAVIIAGDATVRVTSSFGVATLDAERDTLDQVLKRADGALYAAKIAGRDRVHATPSIQP